MKKTMAIFAFLLSLLIVLTGCRKDAPAAQETQESAIAATEERESAETEPTETEPAETESEAIGQYGNCTRCGVGIYDWNFQIESFEGYCRDCYLETLDPALICDNCGRDGSFIGMIDGLCELCYHAANSTVVEFCKDCGRGAIPLNENGLCEACANGACVWCGGPVSDSHNCDDYPNVNCPNCDWGMFTTGVGIDGIICPVCGTRVV